MAVQNVHKRLFLHDYLNTWRMNVYEINNKIDSHLPVVAFHLDNGRGEKECINDRISITILLAFHSDTRCARGYY